ncbi:hypothetical protein ABIC28_005457 [Rhodococcus sp. PvR044]|uniref:hypothetical protein n=1 Tax=Rhodococcus sp. PvR044 TaxID=3156402 RepID=UPI0033919FC9
MTCSAVTSWRGGPLTPTTAADSSGSVTATPILDWSARDVERLYDRVLPAPEAPATPTSFLRTAHTCVRREVRGVYALDDQQPMSTTIRRGRGSCSQRLAVVEGLARRHSIRTRVRGLVLHGEFWYPRFRYLHGLVPDRVLLAWPEFLVEGRWLDASEIFDGGDCTIDAEPFANSGEETLFDALARAPINWGGQSSRSCLDLSGFVAANLGTFDSRDELFGTYGQTIARPIRAIIEPFFSRWNAR